MGWKRKTLWAGKEREGGRCDVDCDFPNECRGLTASEQVERAHKKGASKFVDRLHERIRVCVSTLTYTSFLSLTLAQISY